MWRDEYSGSAYLGVWSCSHNLRVPDSSSYYYPGSDQSTANRTSAGCNDLS